MNEQINELHKKLDAQDKIINTQALEIARLNNLKTATDEAQEIIIELQQRINKTLFTVEFYKNVLTNWDIMSNQEKDDYVLSILNAIKEDILGDTDKEIQQKVIENSKDYIIEKLQQENKQLKEELEVSQSNEETCRLEMLEITKILGLDEHTLFDDVKLKAKSLNSILTELEEWLKAIMENASLKWGDNCAREFDLGCLDIEMTMKNYGEVLDKIQKLKEKYK